LGEKKSRRKTKKHNGEKGRENREMKASFRGQKKRKRIAPIRKPPNKKKKKKWVVAEGAQKGPPIMEAHVLNNGKRTRERQLDKNKQRKGWQPRKKAL